MIMAAVGKPYSVAGFQFRLVRQFDSIFSNTYLPCMMLLLISFIGFLIPVQMVPGRMALLVTIFLMLVNITTSLKATGPRVLNQIYSERTSLCLLPIPRSIKNPFRPRP